MPDLTERAWNDTFGANSFQDGTYWHLAKADYIAPPGLSVENTWLFTPRAQNESHESILAMYHRWRVNQSQSVVAEIAILPFVKTAEYVEAALYDVWESRFVVRKENSSGSNPSPNLLIDP